MTTENENTTDEIKNLDVNTVYPNPDQPRKAFDEASLKELADSITKHGVIQPVTVVKTDKGYMIVAGERRFRATLKAGLKPVPAVVKNYDEKETKEVALLENLQREDLNPIEEALGYKSLIEEYGLTQDEAAKSVGKSRPAVANAMRLLGLKPEVLKMVEEGKLSAGHARTLLPLEDAALQLSTAKNVIDNSLSVRKTEQLVAKTLKKLREPEKKPTKSEELFVDYIADTADYLSRTLSRKVNIECGKRSGRIVLEFYDSDDREALIQNLVRMGGTWQKNND